MNKFTVKDFIVYNSPCLSCNSLPIINVFISNEIDMSVYTIKPILDKDLLSIDLKIKYKIGLCIEINCKNNKFVTNNKKSLTSFLKESKIRLESYCKKCHTKVQTEFLSFNLEKEFIQPISLFKEILYVTYKQKLYAMKNDYDRSESIILIKDLSVIKSPKDNKQISMTIPIMPLSQFKNKEKFIKKLDTYVLFS